MKSKRQQLILKLIEEKSVKTQDELTLYLRSHGFNVTQATVSRDIKELGLVKVSADKKSGKGYKYRNPEKKKSQNVIGMDNKSKSILSGSISSADFAGNLAVLKTYSGMAQAAAASLDSMELSDIVGTVAGDDTVLVILRTTQDAEGFVKFIKDNFI